MPKKKIKTHPKHFFLLEMIDSMMLVICHSILCLYYVLQQLLLFVLRGSVKDAIDVEVLAYQMEVHQDRRMLRYQMYMRPVGDKLDSIGN